MNFEQTIIVGNLGADPDMRYTPSGKAVTSLSVAVNRTWTDANGQKQERTKWYRVSAWDALAETCSKYLVKGQEVMVIGEMEEPSVWTDKQGVNRASLEVRARSVQFGSKNSPGHSSPDVNVQDEESIPF